MNDIAGQKFGDFVAVRRHKAAWVFRCAKCGYEKFFTAWGMRTYLNSQECRKCKRKSKGVLTPSEHAVAELVMEGDSNSEIAEKLDLSERTVQTHIVNINQRLNLRNRVQLAVWMVKQAKESP